MKTKREGANYLHDTHEEDAAFQSPAEKKKKQQQDIEQNKQDLKPAQTPSTNTTLGKGNQMEGNAERGEVDKDKLNP